MLSAGSYRATASGNGQCRQRDDVQSDVNGYELELSMAQERREYQRRKRRDIHDCCRANQRRRQLFRLREQWLRFGDYGQCGTHG